MKKRFISILAASVLTIIISCNKIKQATKLQEGKWTVTTMSVDNDIFEHDELPILKFTYANPYKEAPKGKWFTHDETAAADFLWQFSEKGKTFTLVNQSDITAITATGSEADELAEIYTQCSVFSGKYAVVKQDKTNLELQSKETMGFSGKTVSIVLMKK